MPNHLKKRFIYLVIASVTIAVGLATRKMPQYFPVFIATYGGDTLWASLFFFVFRFIFPVPAVYKIAIGTYAFALAIEISQLYHAPWIDQFRHTFFGKMILGSGFLWSDLICYAIGTLFAWLLATLFEKSPSLGQ